MTNIKNIYRIQDTEFQNDSQTLDSISVPIKQTRNSQNMSEYCYGFFHTALWLALPGSRVTHVLTSTQANYIATYGPQAVRDLRAVWSCHICMMQL